MLNAFFLNPKWGLFRIVKASRKSINLLCITFSKTFDITRNRETGLWLLNISASLDLYKENTLASLNGVGKTPSIRDRLHKCLSGLVKNKEMCFKNVAFLSSYPAAPFWETWKILIIYSNVTSAKYILLNNGWPITSSGERFCSGIFAARFGPIWMKQSFNVKLPLFNLNLACNSIAFLTIQLAC